MAFSGGFHITRDTLTPSLRDMNPRVEAAVDLVFDYFASHAESQMRIGAPWTDRTGNARAGLRAVHIGSGGDHSLVLFHTMPYGIWLEVIQDGKYAIIGPTQLRIAAEIGPVLATAVRRAMEAA